MNLTPDKRIAGLLAPLFALRSEQDLGVGDVRSLRELVDWAAEQGFGLVQLLPINETSSDNSPYMAVSSVALEPTTIAISPELIPELSRADYDLHLSRVDMKALRSGPVQYAAVKALKRALLQTVFDSFRANGLRRNTIRVRRFKAFVKEEAGWLEDYALFRTLMEQHGTECWDRWPEEQSTAAKAKTWLAGQSASFRRAFELRMRFFMYVQWLAFTQWRELKLHCDRRGVALMGDIPFGVSYYSADVFAHPELFDLRWSGGAPPEILFKDDLFTQKWGQNWGIPLYRWQAMEADGYAWWRMRVSKVREMFHLFRIDHVLGFFRIYSFPWRPERNGEFLPLSHEEAAARTGGELPHFIERDDSTPENRGANYHQGRRILEVLGETVGQNRLVGEDLGQVPDYVRPCLNDLGIAGFKIPQWERKHDGWLVDGPYYQRLAVTTYATHDHPPLKVLWSNLYKTTQESSDESGHALDEMRKLAGFAQLPGELPRPWDDEVHEYLLRGLFDSNAWIASVMVTDLFASEQRFNVPGAIADSNWSERLSLPVTQWSEDPGLRAKVLKAKELLQRSGRSPVATS